MLQLYTVIRDTRFKDTLRFKIKGWKKMYLANSIQNRIGAAVLNPDKYALGQNL